MLYTGSRAKDKAVEESEEEDMWEVDLNEIQAGEPERFLALGRFFSGKKFNPRGMFEEMRIA